MRKVFVVFLAVLMISCSKGGNSTATKTPKAAATTVPAAIHASYTPQQVVNLIKQKKNLLIVDVRSPKELRAGKLRNSIMVPFWDIIRGKYNIPHNRPVLLVCAVGGRSYAAMQILAKNGYSEVYNMKGGMNEWKREGRPVVH
ncbi:MAG: rhodanese-like domain-containing protein [Deltaproteobacteria bacterium]|nr:rhodanese-like domain-containing protein [Deltaproteobacteria bacterium]